MSSGLGASVKGDDGTPRAVDLADAIAAVAEADGPSGVRVGRIENRADPMYFSDAATIGKRQLDAALGDRPTLVVGIDDLFWHVYGAASTDQQRLDRLETRLAQLAEVKCSLIIGDIPDMSPACPGLLSQDQVAPESVRREANERITQWAVARPNVKVFPLGALVDGARAGRVVLPGEELSGTAAEELISADRLHASAEGLSAVGVCVVALVQEAGGSPTVQPLPSLAQVRANLTPRDHDGDSGWLGLYNTAMELRAHDEASQRMSIELSRSLDYIDEGFAPQVAKAIPDLWVREMNSRSFFGVTRYQRNNVYERCVEVYPAARDSLIAVRRTLEQLVAQSGPDSRLVCELVDIDRLLREPLLHLDLFRAGITVECSGVESRRPLLDNAWWMLAEANPDELGGYAALFTQPAAAARAAVESYSSTLAAASRPGSIMPPESPERARELALGRCLLLGRALDAAGRTGDAEEVRSIAQRGLRYEELPVTPPQIWYLFKWTPTPRFLPMYRSALEGHFGLAPSGFAPSTDDTMARIARDLCAKEPSAAAEVAEIVDRWYEALPTTEDAVARAVSIGRVHQFDRAVGRPLSHIDALIRLRADPGARQRTEVLARRTIVLAAQGDSAEMARAAGLFDDYPEWPGRADEALRTLDKETTTRWMSNESLVTSRSIELAKELHAGADCLAAAGREKEAAPLRRAAKRLMPPDPAWLER